MTGRKAWRTFGALLAAGAMIASVGCGDDSDSASDDDTTTSAAAATPKDDIVIGLSVEDTGPNATVQAASGEGMRAAAEAINDAGGIDGAKIKIVERDSGGDAAKVILNVQEMIDEGAVAIIGPQTGGACQAVAPTLAKAGVPGVCVTPADLPEDDSYVFGIGVELKQVDAAVFEELAKENKKVGVLSQKTPLGDLINAHIKTSTPDGATIDVKQIDPADTSAKAQLQGFVTDEVGGVFIGACGPIAVTAAKELIDLGYTGKIMLYNCFASESAAKAVQGFTNGNIEVLAPAFILNEVTDDNPQKDAIEAYQAAGGKGEIVFASGWDGVQLIAQAIAAGKSSKSADIVKTLEDDFEFQGVWSSSTMTKDDHRGASAENALTPAVFTTDGKLKPADS